MNNQLSVVDLLVKLQPNFEKQNAFGLAFNNECLFARQQIMKNDFVFSTAKNNPESLRSAILNVAAIGISLNPASAHCYLVPRDGAICLDISYRGLVKLATDSGAIAWAKPELVYEGDTFEYKGPSTPPNHVTDPFDTTHTFENLKGVYCIAKLVSGDYMIEVMSKSEIDKIKDTSKAKSGPWKTWPEEMAKKSVVKRASKSWPQSNGRERIDKAVEILNQHEGLIEERPEGVADYLEPSKEQAEKYLELVKGDPVALWAWYQSLDQRIQVSLPGRHYQYEQGKKQETAKAWGAAISTGRSQFLDLLANLKDACERQDEIGYLEVIEGLSETVIEALHDKLDTSHAAIAAELSKQTAA